MHKTPLELAHIFFDLWTANRMDAALEMVAEDVYYDNVPYSVIIGRKAVRDFHVDFGFGDDWRAEFLVDNIAVNGNVVLSERKDIFYHSSGAVITLPVMGMLIFEDGIIKVWRDYFDPKEFDKQVAVIKGQAN